MAHCTACGQPNQRRPDGHHECLCGNVDYKNPAPAASVAIVRDGDLLLAKRANQPKQGEWDLPGGFIEPGEVVTEGLRREIREETGLELENLRRLHQAAGDYAGKPTLNFIYTATATGEPLAGDDVAELAWFPLSELPPIAWQHESAAVAKLQ